MDFIELLKERIEVKNEKVKECADVIGGDFPDHMKAQFAGYAQEHLSALKELNYLKELIEKHR